MRSLGYWVLKATSEGIVFLSKDVLESMGSICGRVRSKLTYYKGLCQSGSQTRTKKVIAISSGHGAERSSEMMSLLKIKVKDCPLLRQPPTTAQTCHSLTHVP